MPEDKSSKTNIRFGAIGMDLNSSVGQLQKGKLTYALNAIAEGFDGNQVNYQVELGNVECINFPVGYQVIGVKNITQINKIVWFLANPISGNSQIGYTDNNSCIYTTLISDAAEGSCKLGFSIDHPIHKVIVKTTNCATQLYWTDAFNYRRFLDLDDLPWKEEIDPENDYKRIKLVGQLDCNKLNVQPDFSIPIIKPKVIEVGGNLTEGVYQYAIQYANSVGEGTTSVYNITDGVSIFDNKETPDFNNPTAKAVTLEISNLDVTGLYEYFNLIVLETVNLISTPKLIGTFPIADKEFTYTHTGFDKLSAPLDYQTIFEKFPYYDVAGDVFEVGNVLGWAKLTQKDDMYQKIWSKVNVMWETHRIPYNEYEGYSNGINSALYRGYMRDEVYPLEGWFIKRNGKETKASHIPGRIANAYDRELIDIGNKDNAFSTASKCAAPIMKERWNVYNTASSIGFARDFCKETIPNNEPDTTEPVNTVINGTVEIVCSDEGCSKEGHVSLKFVFERPLPVPTVLYIGEISNDGTIQYSGNGIDNSLFTPPAGAIPTVYFDVSGQGYNPASYQVAIPAGVSTFNANQYIVRPGAVQNPNFPNLTYGAWACQSCGRPITTLYIKSNNPLVQLDLDSPQNVNIVTLNTPAEEPEAPAPVVEEPVENVNCTPLDDCYIGPYQYGQMAYWESSERYPNNSLIWGDLAGQKIRHHKFPDLLVSPIHDNNPTNARSFQHSIYPIGFKIDAASLYEAIQASDLSQEEKDDIVGFKIARGNRANNKSIIAKGLIHNVGESKYDERTFLFPNYPFNDVRPDPYYVKEKIEDHSGYQPEMSLDGFANEGAHERFVFHSPDTHFYQPSLNNQGSYLKFETIEYGKSIGHFDKVLKNAEYKFLTRRTIYAAAGLGVASGVTIAAGMFGWPTFSMAPVAPTYTAASELFEKLVPYTNFGYNFNSVGFYSNSYPIPNEGNKRRAIDYNKYLNDGINRVDGGLQIQNMRRESSVYVSTNDSVPFPHEYSTSIPQDNSRYNLSSIGDGLSPESVRETNIASYYGSLKREVINQWGRMYSYESLGTGYYQQLWKEDGERFLEFPTIFGGDIFINRFAYKSKHPFFRDNTVGAAPQTGIPYDELGTLNYPMFWLSTKPASFNIDISKEVDSVAEEFFNPSFFDIIANIFGGGARGSVKAMSLIKKLFTEIYEKVGIKNLNLDRPEVESLFERGLMYLFAYGVPYFFCESEVNVDYRKATNSREGNFYPNVGGEIPDDWVQEINVPIAQDNTYNYNKSFSKQNKENFISHLREDWDPDKKCLTEFPNRAIISDDTDRANNWLVYRPSSYFDFPKTHGELTSVDGLENRQVLVRFVNKAYLYNALLTAQSSAGPVYFGQRLFNPDVPPIDFAETDLGYSGSQHKFLFKTEYGHISIDSKRGQIFLIQGTRAQEIAGDLSKYLLNNLKFKILESFPGIDVDNHFKGLGLHGVYDSRFNRLLITKLDFEPIVEGITHENGKFILDGKEIKGNDDRYFCNKSFTLSFDFDSQSFISFHTYLPNYYIGEADFFYSGINDGNSSVWKHLTQKDKFISFYGKQSKHIVEFPFAYQGIDEILQSVSDYSKVYKYANDRYVQTNEDFYNKAWIYNDEQCAVLTLSPKPRNNMAAYSKYPKYNIDSKEILFVRSGSNYNYNSFHNIVKDQNKPFFKESCESMSIIKELDVSNLDFANRPFKKTLIRARDTTIRHILDNKTDVNIISQFLLTQTTPSYK